MQTHEAHGFCGTRRYVIEREIGQGGMGVVYQALDLERNTRVALKALSQRDAVHIYRLKNEFRQLADLSHPNLVSLHELCNEGEWWFFTMDLVDGCNFDVYVGETSAASETSAPSQAPERSQLQTVAGGRIIREASVTLSQQAIGNEFPLPRVTCSVRRLRHVLRQLVEAVAALHNAGKLHRDIKPSNVLVTPQGRVIVLDFGLVSSSTLIDPEAQEADRTVGGCVFGTPAYMSPEQAAGETITPASDWYSVGAMLYEALTGQLPFDGSVLEILKQKEECEPVPPSDVVKGVPDDLDQLCRDLLRRDPERRPSGPEILRVLTGHSDPPPIFDAQSTVHSRQGELFVGRERHLQELREGFEEARAGRPVTVFLSGVSGMGKSALARCFANELIRKNEAVVLRGRCYERETVPYKAFDNIIDALSRYLMRLPADQTREILPRNVHSLARLFPVLKRVKAIHDARRPLHQTSDARELRNQAFTALKDLLLRITDYQPLVVQIDDLQWGDVDSARLFSHLMGPPDPPPILLVGAYRRDEAVSSPFLQHVLSDTTFTEGADVREVRVDALGAEEAQALASELLRDLPAASALLSASLAAEAEGVPFFINELVQHVRSHARRGPLAYCLEAVKLENVVAERVASMPKEAQRLLEVLAVAAAPIEQGIALQAAGLSSGDRSFLFTLRAARLVRTRGTRQSDRAEIYHDRVRETVVARMHHDAIRITHQKLAEALNAWNVDDPDRLVVHYTAAGNGVRAGETAIQAAHAAATQLAFNRAAELYKKAIELLGDAGEQGRQLHEKLGDALANAGRGAQAAEVYLKAAEGAAQGDARRLRRLAAQQYLRSGRTEEGVPLAAALLQEAGYPFPRGKKAAVAAVLAERLRLAMTPLRPARGERQGADAAARSERLETLGALFREVMTLDPLRGSLLQTRFLREALQCGDPTRVMQGLAWEAIGTAFAAGATKRRQIERLLQLTEERAHAIASPYAQATVQLARAGCSLCMGDVREVEQTALCAETTFKESCPGTSWEATFARLWRYAGIELAGNLASLKREAPEAERNARDKDDDFSLGSLTLVVPLSHLMNDEPRAALEHLAQQRARVSGEFTMFHLWIMDRTADAHLYSGNPQCAWAHLNESWPLLRKSFLWRAALLRVNAHFLYGRVALATGCATGERSLLMRATRAAQALQKFPRPDATAYACLIEAGVARALERHDQEQAMLDQAISVCETAGIRNFALYAKRNRAIAAGSASAEQLGPIDATFSGMGIAEPARWVRTYAPGFEE